MKTKDVPAIVMLLAGGVYCLFGILYRIPLMDFTVQLLIVLIVFWILGGVVKMVLDRFMGEVVVKTETEDSEETEESEEAEGENSDEDAENDTSAESKDQEKSQEE